MRNISVIFFWQEVKGILFKDISILAMWSLFSAEHNNLV